ncbi:MAG: hypothetical protein V1738_00970 [Patescibacteria group bacterium]
MTESTVNTVYGLMLEANRSQSARDELWKGRSAVVWFFQRSRIMLGLNEKAMSLLVRIANDCEKNAEGIKFTLDVFDHLIYQCVRVGAVPRDYVVPDRTLDWALVLMEKMYQTIFSCLSQTSICQNSKQLWRVIQLAISVILHDHYLNRSDERHNMRNRYTTSNETLSETARQAKEALTSAARQPQVRQQLEEYLNSKEMTQKKNDAAFSALRRFLRAALSADGY